MVLHTTVHLQGSVYLTNSNPKPAANPGSNQIMRLDFNMPVPKNTLGRPLALVPRFSATTALATVPNLSALFLRQQADLPVPLPPTVPSPVRHIMLKELLDPLQKPACPLKLAISECRGAPLGPPVLPWGIPANCLNAMNEPNSMLAEGEPIQCR